MEWTIRLEARTGWGELTTCEIGALRRSLGELTADGVGLGLAEAKALLAEVQQRIVQSQIDEYVTCARGCRDCLKLRRLRDQRTRTLQTLFGTVKVAAPRIRLCTCADTRGMFDVSLSPLSHVLPDRCTGELRRLQAELGARHSFREATRLLETFLPCSPPNHASVRNRLHRVASRIEAVEAAAPQAPAVPRRRREARAEILVMLDGAHLRAVPGHHSRHLDVTVGKVETAGRPPRRFALTPLGAVQPAQTVTAALHGHHVAQHGKVGCDFGRAPGRLLARLHRADCRTAACCRRHGPWIPTVSPDSEDNRAVHAMRRLPSATCDGRSVGDAFSLTVRPGAECLQGAGRSGRAVPREA